MKYQIKVSKFRKKYKNKEVVIKDILITKRITLLLGKNGSGKSTLLKAIGGLIKYEGSISVIGKVAYMSEFNSFPHDLKLIDFINSLNSVSKHSISDIEIKKLFKMFNLYSKKDELLSSLSKGMKAKVNLVQILIDKSDIYLLDEPINGLDKEGVKCLIDYLEKSDKCFVISTHLVDDFKNLKSEIIAL